MKTATIAEHIEQLKEALALTTREELLDRPFDWYIQLFGSVDSYCVTPDGNSYAPNKKRAELLNDLHVHIDALIGADIARYDRAFRDAYAVDNDAQVSDLVSQLAREHSLIIVQVFSLLLTDGLSNLKFCKWVHDRLVKVALDAVGAGTRP